jgi:type I restriction enzyme, S subunit
MNNWKKGKLGELCTNIAYGYTASAKQDKIGPKFLRITDIQNDYIDWESVPYCTIKENDYKKYKLEVGDIIIARTGNSTGATGIIKENVEAVFASYLIRFRLNKEIANPFYFDFILRSKQWRDFIQSIKGGSAQPGANAKQLAEFEFYFPEIDTQNTIVSILTSLDDKIELNHRMNQKLEQIAATLFKKYFVDDIDEENLPEGWQQGKMCDITIRITKGTTPTTLKREFVSAGINFLKVETLTDEGTFDFRKLNFIDKETDELLSRSRIQNDDILFSIAGTLGRMAKVNKQILPANTNQALAIIRPDKNLIHPLFIYYYLKLQETREDIFSKVVQGVQANLSLGVLSDTAVIIPDKNYLDKTFEVIAPLHQKFEENENETNLLSKIRDILASKLISGEIDVAPFQQNQSLHESALS